MAKRHDNHDQSQNKLYAFGLKHQAFVWKLVQAAILVIVVLYGISNGYPLVAQGRVVEGILTGLAYGGGALLLILFAIYLNRKLKGM